MSESILFGLGALITLVVSTTVWQVGQLEGRSLEQMHGNRTRGPAIAPPAAAIASPATESPQSARG